MSINGYTSACGITTSSGEIIDPIIYFTFRWLVIGIGGVILLSEIGSNGLFGEMNLNRLTEVA